MPAGLRTKGLLRKGTILGSAVALVAGITAASAAAAVPASGLTAASGSTTASTAASDTSGTLPTLPDGLNVAIGAPATANSGSAPGSSLASVDDGDGTTRWCPSTLGINTVTLDLGRTIDLSGSGVTFSGEEGDDGSFYSIKAGLSPSDEQPLPNQAAGDRNSIVQGPLYLFAGTTSDVSATVPARYVTLSYQVPREQNICVQELRVFSPSAQSDPGLELGDDLSTLTADTGTYTVNGQSAPLLIPR